MNDLHGTIVLVCFISDNNNTLLHFSAPTLQFERAEYSIREPDSSEGSRQLTVRVIRTGDVSETSKVRTWSKRLRWFSEVSQVYWKQWSIVTFIKPQVRCSTRDGSAKSGSDYEPKSRMLRFQPGQTSAKFKVTWLCASWCAALSLFHCVYAQICTRVRQQDQRHSQVDAVGARSPSNLTNQKYWCLFCLPGEFFTKFLVFDQVHYRKFTY